MASLDDVLDSAADAVELDLSGSVDYDDVPNGEYIAKLVKIDTDPSKAGQRMLTFRFEIAKVISVDGDEAPPSVGSLGLPAVRSMLEGKAAWRTKKHMMPALGFTAPKGEKIKFSPSQAIGRYVRGVVKQQESNPEYQEFTDLVACEAPSDALD